ncbi:hypothetical protein Btru_028062 [Bulinus truncatus]|nr:hypothetical protein Btru_028062 [Bulinus truncatus]
MLNDDAFGEIKPDLFSRNLLMKSWEMQTKNRLRLKKVITLSNNNMTSVSSNLFENMKQLRVLRINDNKLVCDCHMAWFARWLRKNPTLGLFTECHQPLHLRNTEISELQDIDFKCDALSVPQPALLNLMTVFGPFGKEPFTFKMFPENVILAGLEKLGIIGQTDRARSPSKIAREVDTSVLSCSRNVQICNPYLIDTTFENRHAVECVEENLCPRQCRCSEGVVDCRDKGLTQVPDNIPESAVEMTLKNAAPFPRRRPPASTPTLKYGRLRPWLEA